MRLTDYTTFPDICDKYKKKGDVLKYNAWVDVMEKGTGKKKSDYLISTGITTIIGAYSVHTMLVGMPYQNTVGDKILYQTRIYKNLDQLGYYLHDTISDAKFDHGFLVKKFKKRGINNETI